MKETDRDIIGDIFRYVRLEQDMPKLTTKEELARFQSPTLVIAGTNDIFFPEKQVKKKAQEIIPHLIDFKTYEMGHFPSAEHLVKINENIAAFFESHY